MRILVLVISLFVTTAILAQKTSKVNAEKTKAVSLFTVNKVPVTTDEFIYLYKKNNSGKPENFTDVKIQEYLDLFINFKLKVTEATQRGMDTTALFQKEFKSYREELKKPYQAEADDLERLTKEVYQRLNEEVKAAHILISVAPDADTTAAYSKMIAIRNRVLAGENFEKLASELSEDPSAKGNGGSLGYFTAMQMVYPFEDAVFKLKVNEVSMPVRTRFGYHLIKVADRRPSRGEVEVSHILLRADQTNAAKIKNKIFEIHDQLRGGRSWDELCKEYSDDASTKNAGGRLRPFGVGALASVPEFEKTAFELTKPGEISDPFQSALGWHIVRLEKKIPLAPYSELQASLKRRVSRDERLQISKAAVLAKRKKDFAFTETDLKSKMISQADSTLLNGKWKYTGSAEWKTATLFTLHGQAITGNEFILYVEKNQAPSGLSAGNYMQQLYDKFTEEKINELDEKKLLEENPEYRNLLNEYREGILLFGIMEKEVWNKASEDTTGQRGFYEQNKAKYTAGDRVEARLFSTTDKTFLESIKSKIAKGDSISKSDLKQFKSVQNFRAYERGDSKVVDKVSWAAGLHEAEDNGIYYLVEISRLLLPGTKTFNEARASVISDYQDELEKKWLVTLRGKYPVQVNKKGKKMVFTELKKNEASK
ncbi:MAG: peptidylprolyl isomerase [Azospira oryzae]|nr:MAG: peptidylprolyl isomerase [Azospira oryzae]